MRTEVSHIQETGDDRVFVRGPSVSDKLVSIRKMKPPEDKKRHIRRSTSEKKDKKVKFYLQ